MKSRMMRIALAVEVLVLIAWLVFVILISKDIYETEFFSVTLICGVIAFTASIGLLFYLSGRANRALTEVRAISIIISVFYLLVALIINSVFLIAARALRPQVVEKALQPGIISDKPGALLALLVDRNVIIIINVVLLASYIILCIGVGEYYHRANRQTRKIVEKVLQPGIISNKLGALLALPIDQDVRKRLLTLKEHVDYSSNMTQFHTADYQDRMEQVLDQIESSISANEGPDKLISFIDQAEQIWGMRNSADTTMR